MLTTEPSRIPVGAKSRNPDPGQRTAGSNELEGLEEYRTRCEVWTRVMGYHRPTGSFNQGQQAEYRERKFFDAKQVRA